MKKLVCIILVMLLSVEGSFAQKSKSNFEISKNLQIFSEIYRQLDRFYVDTLSADTAIDWAIRAMLDKVDPFTVYFSESEMDNLKMMTTGKYAGIGAVVRMNRSLDRVMIAEPYEGTPAHLVGLRAGDVILSINNVDVKGMPVDKVSKMLRGDAGTVLDVKIQRYAETKPLSFKITRKTIQQPAIPYYGVVRPGVGYIYLTEFTEGCAKEVRDAFLDLKSKGAQSLVLDLRGNPGGLLDEAVEIVNLFVPKGKPIVSTKGKLPSANRTFSTLHDAIDLNIPLAVMVDEGTASSAEIVSGALQDLDRAVILGQRTYGKGLVQSTRELPYQGALKVTTSRYYIPSGRCIQAYDYRNLKADGSVGTVPDSLTKVFKTLSGREVRDGGGIKPDIKVAPDSLPTMVYDLASSDEMFHWVTKFCAAHKTIAPADRFELTDADYADFVKTIEESKFTYNNRSDEVLNVLEQVAKREGYYDEATAEFDALRAKFNRNLSSDLNKFRSDINKFICSDIVRRYYYQKGNVVMVLRDDPCFEKTLSVIADKEQYNKILNK